MKRNPKTLIILLLSMLLLGGAALAGGCLDTKQPAEAETPNQESSVSEYLNQLVKELEKEEVKAITPEEAYALMQSNSGYVIIDTRTPEAFANEHIEGAINIDYQSENFRDELNQLDKSNATFAYYKPYGRASQCCGTNDTLKEALDIFQTFKGLQFKEAYFINDGIIAWKIRGFPTTK